MTDVECPMCGDPIKAGVDRFRRVKVEVEPFPWSVTAYIHERCWSEDLDIEEELRP